MPNTSKKLVLVLATSALMTKASKENEVALNWVFCIYYPFCFQKDTIKVKALIDSGSKVNIITPTYAAKLGLKVCHTNVRAQKIDGSTLKIFKIGLASFQVEYKLGWA